jgi:hypothetical protein
VLPSHLTLLIVALKALYDALLIVDEQLGISSAVIEFYNDHIAGTTIFTTVLTFVLAKLSQAIQTAAYAMAFFIEAGLLGFVFPAVKVLDILLFLAEGFDALFRTNTAPFIQSLDDAATALQDKLVKGMGDSAKASAEAAGRLFSMDTSLGKVKTSAEATAAALKKVEVTSEVLRAVFDIFNKGLDEAAKGTQANTDQNIAALDRLAEAQKTFVNVSISDEGYRAARIFEIENGLRTRQLAAAEESASQLTAIAEEAQRSQLATIKSIGDASDQKLEDRIKKEAEVRQKFLETETQITADFRGKLAEQLKAVRDAQNQRVQIIRETADRIKDREIQLASAIADIRLGLLAGDRANSFIRDQIRVKENLAQELAARGEFERARRVADEINGLVGKVTGPDISGTLASIARIGAASSIDEAKKAMSDLGQSTDTTSEAYQRLSGAVFFAHGPEDMAKIAVAAQQFQTAIQKSADNTAANEKIDILTRTKNLQDEIDRSQAASAAAQKATLEEHQKAIEARLVETENKLNDLREKLAQPIETLVNFSPETSAVEAAIRELTSRNIVVPVTFQTNRGVNMEGFSVHPIEDVGRLIREKFNPGAIETSYNVATGAFGNIVGGEGSAAAGGFGAPSKHVRVDLNFGGETTTVDTKDDASANALVGFAKNLQNIKKARGSYSSPFSRY